MKILGIETSCDETASAIVKTTADDFTIEEVSNIVHSQIDIHKEFGGVVPNLAKREHEKLLGTITIQALKEAGEDVTPNNSINNISKIENIFTKNQVLLDSCKNTIFKIPKPNIDLIAVTNGPGLEPALWVGVTFARALSILWDTPIIGVDHMQGHICANFIGETKIQFPAIALTISGGHTQLVYMKKPLSYELLGETLDDAAGESFDKVARMLSLPYPGGPIISKLAEQGDKEKYPFPRPMIHTKDFNFSFSGLKTAVLYLTQKMTPEQIEKEKENISSSFQQAVIDVVIKKTINAINQYDAKSIVIGGGVSANTQLREQLKIAVQNTTRSTLYVPKIHLAGDNAAMIASSGALEHIHNKITHNPLTLEVDANKQIA